MLSDPNLAISVAIATAPVLIVLALAYFYKGMNGKQLSFLVGFLAVTSFVIFTPDPLFISKFSIAEGDYATPLWIASISTLLLITAVFFFRRHMES